MIVDILLSPFLLPGHYESTKTLCHTQRLNLDTPSDESVDRGDEASSQWPSLSPFHDRSPKPETVIPIARSQGYSPFQTDLRAFRAHILKFLTGSIFFPWLVLRKPRMVTNRKFVRPVVDHLSGAKNGSGIGTMFVGAATLVAHRVFSSLLKATSPRTIKNHIEFAKRAKPSSRLMRGAHSNNSMVSEISNQCEMPNW